MNDMSIAASPQREHVYKIPPYLGFEYPTTVSHGTSANLDKLGALFAILITLGPLAAAAFGGLANGG